jgi:SAM-dependent methyltransferase
MTNWKERQQRELDYFLKHGAEGVFSHDGHPSAVILRKYIEKYCEGKLVLDVGCGLLPRPSYMPKSVFFVGIDPHELEVERDFRFVQGKAEEMPFEDEEFFAVVFATTLDHVEDVEKTIDEALRVLQIGGYLFIWSSTHSKKEPPDDYFHGYRFTLNELLGLSDLDLIDFEKISNSEVILIFQK